MKNKLVLVAVSLLVTVWPFLLLMVLNSFSDSGSIMMLVVFYFNLFASIIAAVICWGSTVTNKPRGFIAAGIVLILPVVYFMDVLPVVIMIVCLGTVIILIGLYYKSKTKTVHVVKKMNRLDWIYLAAVILLTPLQYGMITLAPVRGRPWEDYYSYAQPIMILVILLAVCAMILKERLFIAFSVFMLAMATMTLNDAPAVQSIGYVVVIYGAFILIKAGWKSHDPGDAQTPVDPGSS